jgi:hypothetical protein
MIRSHVDRVVVYAEYLHKRESGCELIDYSRCD